MIEEFSWQNITITLDGICLIKPNQYPGPRTPWLAPLPASALRAHKPSHTPARKRSGKSLFMPLRISTCHEV